jgi:beta-galactosidase
MKKTLLNRDWLFSSDIHPEKHPVNLPHDAMQTENRIPGLKDGSQSGCYPGGVYTYQKELVFDREAMEQTFFLEFEGVYMNSSVLLNGEKIGGRIYGYSDFLVDLTGKVKEGTNLLTVIADNSQCANSRWYSGSGIYRDVWLHTAGSEYIRPDGLRVLTQSIYPARIRICTDAEKTEETSVLVSVSKDGKVVAEGHGADCTVEIPDAKLWSDGTPELYDVTASLVNNGKVIDSLTIATGIRTIAWDAVKGFQVNGETVKLRGGCVHHDHGFIGTAEYDEACLRRVRIMKEAGFNAVRTSHNPASHAMLRACDKLGMYVMNETFDTWLCLKSPYDYAMYFAQEWEKDMTDMIRVAFNHPSVIMYSIGNEVCLKNTSKAADISTALTALCHKLDDSRPVTNALNPLAVLMGDSDKPEQKQNDKVDPRAVGNASGLSGSSLANVLITYMDKLTAILGNERKMRKINAVMDPLDIVGYNYATYLYKKQHKDYPSRVLVGSETFPAAIYENWQAVKSMPHVTGDFLWTAWDYLGECGIGTAHYGKQGSFSQPYPTISAGCGNIDMTGEILPQGVYCAVVYGTWKDPYLAVHPVSHGGEKAWLGKWLLTDAVHSWDWPGHDGRKTKVDVYSGASRVELFLNGKSLGSRSVERCMASFEIAYGAGELRAVQFDKEGNVTGQDVLYTAEKQKKLLLSPEKNLLRADGQDLLFLPIEITDENGVRKNIDNMEVTVRVEGPAVLAGLGNANLKQESLTPYTGDSARVFGGRALAILRSTTEAGRITVHVFAEGIDPAAITVKSF